MGVCGKSKGTGTRNKNWVWIIKNCFGACEHEYNRKGQIL